MTRRKPDAWAQCPRCERRKRNDGWDWCRRCREYRRLDPDAIRSPSIYDARIVMRGAYQRAQEAGHDMAPIEPDEDGFISYCRTCDGFLVVDLWEKPDAYGRATLPCPGKPPHQPALRREQSVRAARFITPMVACTWTQEEIAWVMMMVPLDTEAPWS